MLSPKSPHSFLYECVYSISKNGSGVYTVSGTGLGLKNTKTDKTVPSLKDLEVR